MRLITRIDVVVLPRRVHPTTAGAIPCRDDSPSRLRRLRFIQSVTLCPPKPFIRLLAYTHPSCIIIFARPDLSRPIHTHCIFSLSPCLLLVSNTYNLSSVCLLLLDPGWISLFLYIALLEFVFEFTRINCVIQHMEYIIVSSSYDLVYRSPLERRANVVPRSEALGSKTRNSHSGKLCFLALFCTRTKPDAENLTRPG